MKKITPSFNLQDLKHRNLFGYDRCCVGIYGTHGDMSTLTILLYVLTYDQAGVVVTILRDIAEKDAVILTQLSYQGR